MSKQRMLNTRFWSDGWVRKLTPLGRYLFLYMLTNEHTNICGIYELPIETIAFETGLDEEELVKTLLPRLAPKVMHINDYIICINFIKHQSLNNPKIVAGIANEIKDIPDDVMSAAISYGYPMDELSHPNVIKDNKRKEKYISYREEFEVFWKEYPRKVGKKKAMEAWDKIMAAQKVLPSTIMLGLAAWKLSTQWNKDDGQFIPHPTTWLNGERWSDEVPQLTHSPADQF